MRHQLPAWSPVTLGALYAGLAPPPDAEARLTERIREEYGAQKVVLTGSGTDALALSLLAAAPAGRRPRIALPGWACYDLMTAADMVDAEVVLYDLVPETLGPDPDSLRAALAAGPQAVIVAHWFGLPVDLARFAPSVLASGAVLIDDAAQGVGTSIRGRPVGSGGEYGILSFGRGKGRTGGAGGAAMAFGEAAAGSLAQAASRLQAPEGGLGSVAALAAQWALGRPWLYGIPAGLPGSRLGATLYHPARPPRRISPRSASIVNRLWALSSNAAAIRRVNAERWRAALGGVEGLHSYVVPDGAVAGWLRYPVLTSPKLKRLLLGSESRRHGVMPGYPGVLSDLPVRPERWLREPTDIPGARTLVERLFTLPTHHHTGDLDIEIIEKRVHTERMSVA